MAEYVGSLRGIELSSGDYIPVRARALGVANGSGIVTGPNRLAVEHGQHDQRPGRKRGQRIRALYYYRRRPEGDWWVHETPDARAVLSGDGDRPDAWISSPGSGVSQPGQFLSNPKGDTMARAKRKRLPPRNRKGQFRKRKRRMTRARRRPVRRRRTRRNPPKGRTKTRTITKTRWRTRRPPRRKPRRKPRAKRNPFNPLIAAALVAAAATLAQGLVRTYVKNPMIREYGPPVAMLGVGWWLMKKPQNRDLGLALAVVGVADIASMLVARFMPAATMPSAPGNAGAVAATQGGLVNIAGGRWAGAFPRGSMFPNFRGQGPPVLLQNNLPIIGAAESYADMYRPPMLVAQ